MTTINEGGLHLVLLQMQPTVRNNIIVGGRNVPSSISFIELFGYVRTLTGDNGEPLFCGNDVANALKYLNPSRDVQNHCVNIVERRTTDSVGRQQNMLFIPESDVYRLIVRSKKPEAVKFERWLMEEVIPSIRKHGAYMTPQTIDKMLSDPDVLIQMLQTLKSEKQARMEAEAARMEAEARSMESEARLEAAKPAIEFDEHVHDMEGTVPMDIFAKVIQRRGINMGRNKLFAWLRSNGYLMKNNQPYQQYSDKYFRSSFAVKYGRFVPYTQVTGQGMLHITKKMFKQQGIELCDTRSLMEDIQTAIQGVGNVA